jgi:hypothetical protein
MNNHELSALRSMIAHVLNNCFAHQWTVQGFGMMRLHLPGNFRLHLWNSSLRIPGVSDIHDHLQWGLMSTIICGSLVNRIWAENKPSIPSADESSVPIPLYAMRATLKPGVGTYFKDAPVGGTLIGVSETRYFAGDTYAQAPNEIHSTHPEDGTITLMQKFPTDDESARVYWPMGTDWVSAEPREATRDEIQCVTAVALEQLMREWRS